MRCLIDTNVLVSAFLWPRSTPAQAIKKATTAPFSACVSPYSLAELREVVARKWPESLGDLDVFIESILIDMVVTTKTIGHPLEQAILRDIGDIPILEDAIGADVDIIISGDKDFTEAGLSHPIVMTPAEFLEQSAK